MTSVQSITDEGPHCKTKITNSSSCRKMRRNRLITLPDLFLQKVIGQIFENSRKAQDELE